MKLKAYENCHVNNSLITYDSPPHIVKNYDRLVFMCNKSAPHLFILVFPNLSDPKESNNQSLDNEKQEVERIPLSSSKYSIIYYKFRKSVVKARL